MRTRVRMRAGPVAAVFLALAVAIVCLPASVIAYPSLEQGAAFYVLQAGPEDATIEDAFAAIDATAIDHDVGEAILTSAVVQQECLSRPLQADIVVLKIPIAVAEGTISYAVHSRTTSLDEAMSARLAHVLIGAGTTDADRHLYSDSLAFKGAIEGIRRGETRLLL